MNEKKVFSAGKWIIAEGGIPAYYVFKLIKGTVSIHKGGREIREAVIGPGDAPIMMGVTALLRPDRMHMASIRAETEVEAELIHVEHILGILRNNIPQAQKQTLKHMAEAINMGNEIISLVNKYFEVPRVNLELPDGLDQETTEVLTEVNRLYTTITHDVDSIVSL